MDKLLAKECRVLGVLIEKALTVPETYPLSLNAIVAGANQKNNRDPVMQLTEDEAFDAVESLRGRGVVVRVDQMGSRVHKFKHAVGDKWSLKTGEVAVLAELLLRGPSTVGEIRGRASRMHPMESLESAEGYLRGLRDRQDPIVREIAAGRAPRWEQLLGDAPAISATARAESATVPESSGHVDDQSGGAHSLSNRVEKLESEVATLREELDRLKQSLGAS